MKVQPTNQSPSAPDLRTLFDALSQEIRKQLNCVRVGIIQSFNAANQTATVLIAQQKITSTQPDGTQTLAQFPLLLEVPVIFPSGGGCTLTFPIAAGDECVVLFNDRDMDNFIITGSVLPPATSRIHDLSDGICIVGINSNPKSLANVSTDSAELRTDDGLTWVRIKPSTKEVHLHGGTVYSWDCHGYGQKVEWTGGNNYTITNYTIGAVITTVNTNINQPVIP